MPTSNRRSLGPLWLLLPLAACAAQSVEFRFAPPEDVETGVTTTRTRRTTRGGKTVADVNRLRLKRRAVKTASGYDVKTTIIESALERDGVSIASPMLTAMADLELTYQVDAEGRLETIHGYDGILTALREKLPGPFFQQMAPLFNAEGLRSNDKRDWNEQVGRYVGKTVRPGEAWVEVETLPLPTGKTAEYYAATVFEGPAECDGGDCFRIAYYFRNDAEELVEAAGEAVRAPLEALDEKIVVEDVAPRISGEGERRLDPSTMETYAFQTTLRAETEGSIGGAAPEPIAVVDTTESVFERRPIDGS